MLINMRAPLLKVSSQVFALSKKDLGIFVPAMQKATDPIQQLFLDKLREFKSKSAGGKLVEPSPELEKELKSDMERIYRQFGFKPGDDLSKIPSLPYKEPNIQFPPGTTVN